MAAPKYTEEDQIAIYERVCSRMAEGSTLKKALEQEKADNGRAPERSTFRRWRVGNKPLEDLYQSAQVDQAHALFEELIDMADEIEPKDRLALEKLRIQIDVRKFAVAKIAPKIYGDKLELSGPNGIPLLPPPPTKLDLSKLTLAELEQFEQLASKATVPNLVEAADAALEGSHPVDAAPLALPDATGAS